MALPRVFTLALALAALPLQAAAGPDQCWFYLHNQLAAKTAETCAAQAASALTAQSFHPQQSESSDGHLKAVTGEDAQTTLQVLCYGVNAPRGAVLAVITASGANACPAARTLFEVLKQAPATSP
ncbi:MAG: hypothetical protein ACSHWZ_05440 [Sulfitobacter sp.]